MSAVVQAAAPAASPVRRCGLGQSRLTVGLVMAPQGLVLMLVAGLGASVSKAKGPKVTLMIGALIVAAGYALNIVMMSEIWQLVLVSCVIGAGVGFAYGALPIAPPPPAARPGPHERRPAHPSEGPRIDLKRSAIRTGQISKVDGRWRRTTHPFCGG